MISDRLHVLAVDDERTQLEDLARMLRGSPAVEVVECAGDGHDALHKLSSQAYDAIFLDVRMPGLDGIELGRVLRRFANPPQLVYVSAYDSAAVDAFELRALDYLPKPVSRRRLEESLERILTALERDGAGSRPTGETRRSSASSASNASSGEETIAVASVRNGALHLISRSAILYVQSQGDFVRIVTAENRYLLRATMSELERRWESSGFVRVHRQYLANLGQARELRPLLRGGAELVFAEGTAIPVARRQAAELSRRLRV